METKFRNTDLNTIQSPAALSTRSLFASVFTWMFIALGITTASSLFFSTSGVNEIFYTQNAMGRTTISIIGWVCMLAPLALVLVMNFAFQRLSFAALISIFFVYAAVNGMSFSVILQYYAPGTIGAAFASTCALFGIMALAGYFTKADLTKLGSILMIGLIGIVVASLINMFMQSSTLSYIISIIAVVVFTGLTAYDVQKIKQLSLQNNGSADFKKIGVIGALSLYLDFINLFLALLRIFGRRD